MIYLLHSIKRALKGKTSNPLTEVTRYTPVVSMSLNTVEVIEVSIMSVLVKILNLTDTTLLWPLCLQTEKPLRWLLYSYMKTSSSATPHTSSTGGNGILVTVGGGRGGWKRGGYNKFCSTPSLFHKRVLKIYYVVSSTARRAKRNSICLSA